MNIKASNELLSQAKFALADLLDSTWEEAMKDLVRWQKIDPEKKFPLNLKLTLMVGNQSAVLEFKANWGVRKEVKGEPVNIAIEPDMFGGGE